MCVPWSLSLVPQRAAVRRAQPSETVSNRRVDDAWPLSLPSGSGRTTPKDFRHPDLHWSTS
ncbi:hypothetical protein PLANTIT3_50028 [Plantibacter sp. T3]|nr:hypothetical protein PLANTIT3_50028 [Plantibacter sp. T3]